MSYYEIIMSYYELFRWLAKPKEKIMAYNQNVKKWLVLTQPCYGNNLIGDLCYGM